MRRYAPMRASRGTVIPPDMRRRVLARDNFECVGAQLGWASHPGEPYGVLELDHVRASHGVGMKSATEEANLVSLCGWCHRWKTANGRTARPILLAYLARVSA